METRLDRAVFVRDGFTFGAFAFGGWWFIAKGHLLAAFILFGAYGLLVGLLAVLGLLPFILPVTFLLALLLGFEAARVQGWALARRGFIQAAVMAGEAGDALEQRFFAQYLAHPSLAPPRSAPAASSPQGSQGTAIGLFPQPNRPFSGFSA